MNLKKIFVLSLLTVFLYSHSAQANISCSAYCVSTQDKFLKYAYYNKAPLEVLHMLQNERTLGGNGHNFESLKISCLSFVVNKYGADQGGGTFLLVQVSQVTGKLVGASPQSSCHTW